MTKNILLTNGMVGECCCRLCAQELESKVITFSFTNDLYQAQNMTERNQTEWHLKVKERKGRI